MDAKKLQKVLPKKKLEEVVQNLDNLSDLSASDSEEDSCYVNSIHSPSDTYLNQLDDDLIEQRLEYIIYHTTRKGKAPTSVLFKKDKRGGRFGVPDKIRLLNVGIHLPEETNTYKRCRFCSTKQKEQRTKQCSACGVALCAKNCFKTFHTVPPQ